MLDFIGENDMMTVAKQRTAFVFLGVKTPSTNGVLANRNHNASSTPVNRKGCSVLCLAASTGTLIRSRALCFTPTLNSLPSRNLKTHEVSMSFRRHKEVNPIFVRNQYLFKLAQEIHEKSLWRCWYCGVEVATQARRITNPKKYKHLDRASVDHKMPISRGGLDEIENLVTACKRCNTQKNNLTIEEYRA